MMNKFKKQMKNEKGLTLIELLAVIVILAIIAAIAIPSIGNIIENSKYNAVKADALNVLNAGNLYFVDNPDEDEVTIPDLKTAGFLDNGGKIDAGTINKGVVGASKVSSNTLTTAAIEYSGTKKVTFGGATVAGINADENKGSGDGGYTIGDAETSTNP